MSDSLNDATEGYQDLNIGLPLPLDMVGVLMSMVGEKWPGALIVTEPPTGSLAYGRSLTIRIPDTDRFFDDSDDNEDYDDTAEPKFGGPVEKRPGSSREDDAYLTAFDDTVGVSLPESITSVVVELCRGLMSEFPDAPNYVEMCAVDKETNLPWIVTVQNPTGKTPHELRLSAEARAEEALKALNAAFTPEALAYLATHPDPQIANAVSSIIVDAASDNTDSSQSN